MTCYLDMQHSGPLILYGKKRLGKRKAAEDIACAVLGCDRNALGHNGDFFLLDKKERSIKAEDILSLLEKSSIATLGSCKVYLVCHAEGMNIPAQNKLLKLLEERTK